MKKIKTLEEQKIINGENQLFHRVNFKNITWLLRLDGYEPIYGSLSARYQ